MKKAYIIFTAVAFFFCSCIEKKEKTIVDEKNLEKSVIKFQKLRGNYLFVNDLEKGPAAVLQLNDEIYGVEIDSMALKLNDIIEPLKQNETDMVLVTLSGQIKNKPDNEEGWPLRFKINEIVDVSLEANDSGVIKIGK
jgi:hypothetical protein